MAKENTKKSDLKMDITTYMTDRVDDQLDWLENKSAANKRLYQFWKLIVIFLSVSIPLFVVFNEDINAFKYVIAAAGVMIAAIEGILSLYTYQTNWINYRQTAEALRSEKLMFLTKSGIYKNSPHFSSFVERVESILSEENKKWGRYVDNEVVLKGEEEEVDE